MSCQAPVGNDLESMFRHQQVDQHAVVVFGVPHAVFAEQHQRAFACIGVTAQVAPGEPRFRHDANLPGVLPLAGSDLRAEALQCLQRDGGSAEGVVPAMVDEPPDGTP